MEQETIDCLEQAIRHLLKGAQEYAARAANFWEKEEMVLGSVYVRRSVCYAECAEALKSLILEEKGT